MQHSIPTNVLKPEEIIAKINDLNLNLMIYNLPESSSLSVNARVESDKTEFMKIINIFTPGWEATNPRCHHVGKTQRNKSRPLKVVFSNAELPIELLKKFLKEDLIKIDPAFSDISISWDRTDSVRKNHKDLRTKLENRSQSRVENLTVKYINGVPEIQKSALKIC